MNKQKIKISDNWKFSVANHSIANLEIPGNKIKPGIWFDALVPGTIHTDLLNNKLIDSDNELKLDWIINNKWIYKTEFHFQPEAKENYNLIFEGIDTIADIYLNEHKILSTENMFIEYKISVGKYLVEGNNELKIFFYSPVKYALEQEAQYGKLPVALNSSRAYIRKAQYSFGWDWGPSFPTSGIWRDVYLEPEPAAETENVRFETLKITKSKAEVRVIVKIKSKKNANKKLLVKLGGIEKQIKVTGTNSYQCEFSIPNPNLWWPNGEGEQNLYELTLSLIDKDGTELSKVNKKVGIRTVELITKERRNNTFKLRVNGRDIFAKGVNWIPADSFLPRVESVKYSKLLSHAKDANMNIVRVWGGGIYESDYFYELCDELGLLVWQDFMFACGAYPELKEFINNVKEEVEQNVLRLQHHPSIALWCGNNENEWGWYQQHVNSYKELPGYKIYHEVIPSILEQLDSQRPYHPSSPFGWDEDPNSFNSGNTHQWDIWSSWIDYENVVNDRSLFVTEFGFQGPANKDTLENVIPFENRSVSDRIFEFHNKQVEGPERIWKFLSAHLPLTNNWNDYFYLTQLNQAFALKTCLEHWRTNGRTNGSIIWQINDSWPVTSWAIVDYNSKPKLAYHFVKEIFSPQILFFSKQKDTIHIKLQNQSTEKFNGSYKIDLVDASTGKIIKYVSKKIAAKENTVIDVASISPDQFIEKDNLILFSFLYDNSGELISSNYYKVSPWKHIKMAVANITIRTENNINGSTVTLSSDKPAYFVDLYSKGIEFDKRGFTIMPGEEIVLNVVNYGELKLRAKDIEIYSLNKYLRSKKINGNFKKAH